jgi:hypothetical protein
MRFKFVCHCDRPDPMTNTRHPPRRDLKARGASPEHGKEVLRKQDGDPLTVTAFVRTTVCSADGPVTSSFAFPSAGGAVGGSSSAMAGTSILPQKRRGRTERGCPHPQRVEPAREPEGSLQLSFVRSRCGMSYSRRGNGPWHLLPVEPLRHLRTAARPFNGSVPCRRWHRRNWG